MATLSITKLIRRLPEYEEWKRSVFIRDRFTCQLCGARNGRKQVIEADHIKGLAELIKEHSIATIDEALRCSLIWDIDNGRTLCHSCHEQTDSYPVSLRGVKSLRRKQGLNY